MNMKEELEAEIAAVHRDIYDLFTKATETRRFSIA
jgi:hypothetical protein